jgi:hypothetical protein
VGQKHHEDRIKRAHKETQKQRQRHTSLHLFLCSEHCLGNMEHVRGAQAVREAKGIDDLDARVATVSM